MEHVLYFDGNEKRISWVIKTNDSAKEQFRDHAEIYLDRVTKMQSKYIALHVAVFWSIGVFIIKNHDTVRVQVDSKEIITHLRSPEPSPDTLAERRKQFIDQLASQRDLNLIFEEIEPEKNLASRML